MMSSKKKPTKPAASILWRVIFSFAIFILFLGMTEIGLRLVGPDLYYRNQLFPINRDINFPEVYNKDADLFWRFKKNFDTQSKLYSEINYHINSLGLRGPEVEKNAKGLRILAIGNSCTFGWGVAYNQSWVTRTGSMVQQELRRPVETINGGIPGYTSHQGKLFLRNELAQLKPNILLIMYGWNDHWPAGQNIPDSAMEMPAQYILTVQNALSNLQTYKLMRKVILYNTDERRQIPIDDLTAERRVSPLHFVANLCDIILQAKSQNMTPILLVPPLAAPKNPNDHKLDRLDYLHSKYQEEIHKTATATKTAIVDLQLLFDGHNEYFDNSLEDPIHFNGLGHKVVATAVTEEIIKILNAGN